MTCTINSPLVSVIIPTYNHRDYVLHTLESVFAQTCQELEVIVVNDGSPDDTASLLEAMAETGRIRYFEQRNAGQASARNRGLAEALGEFIAFLDDDDLWPADKLAWQVNALRASDAILIGGWAAFTANGKLAQGEWGSPPGGLKANDLAAGCPFWSPGQTLIRRSALEAVGGFDEALWGVDDYDLYLRLAKIGELVVERRVSLLYRKHPGDASKQRRQMLANGFRLVRKHRPDFRGAASLSAFRWLYRFAGRERIGHAKYSLRGGKLAAAVEEVKSLFPFVWPACKDFVLLREMLHDLLPGRLQRVQLHE